MVSKIERPICIVISTHLVPLYPILLSSPKIGRLLRTFPNTYNARTFTLCRYARLKSKIQQTKMLIICQRFGDLFLFGLVWQYSTNQNQYNKGRFKVMATYMQQ